jgi:hypothetical protein
MPKHSSCSLRPWWRNCSSVVWSSTGVIVNACLVPAQSGRKGQSVTVHRTDVGRVASSTWITSGSGAFMTNLSSPPVSPDPVAEAQVKRDLEGRRSH